MLEGAKHYRILLLVAAPPASGKTFIGKKIAQAFGDCVYLDLDSLNVLSRRVCDAAGCPFDKDASFFREFVRDYEYAALLAFAFEALDFSRLVIVSAPLTRELRDTERFSKLVSQAAGHGAAVIPVWVLADADACKSNMCRRGAARDQYKCQDMDAYLNRVDFTRPAQISPHWQVDNRTQISWQSDVRRIVTEINARLAAADSEREAQE